MGQYVICYDIRNPKRLLKVHRILKQEAFAIEYSVFLFDGTEGQVKKCFNKLEEVINPRYDDIRCYAISDNGFQYRLGRRYLPEGITCTILPSPLLHLS